MPVGTSFAKQTFARQKQLGVIPEDCQLTARPKEIPAWDSLPADQKRVAARLMETYAGFAEHTDTQVARVTDALQQMGVLDNTLFLYVLGDNGASGEGGLEGAFNELAALNGVAESHGGDFAASGRDRRADGLQPLPRRLGACHWTRRTNGPSRSPRTGAARVTA